MDPNVGGYWTVPGDLVPKSLDNSTIGQFDYISRFSSAWTIAGMFRFPSANIATAQITFNNMDGSNYGFELGTSYAVTRRFWFRAANENGTFLGMVTYPNGNGQYSADTWYYFVLVFNGNGGTGNGGAQGLSAYLIPLTGAPLTTSDVSGDKSLNLAGGVVSGNTTVATTGSTAALRFAGGAYSESLMTDIGIWNTALTDADIQTLANHFATGSAGGFQAPAPWRDSVRFRAVQRRQSGEQRCNCATLPMTLADLGNPVVVSGTLVVGSEAKWVPAGSDDESSQGSEPPAKTASDAGSNATAVTSQNGSTVTSSLSIVSVCATSISLGRES